MLRLLDRPRMWPSREGARRNKVDRWENWIDTIDINTKMSEVLDAYTFVIFSVTRDLVLLWF